ncbi:heme lyase CcmF/NrfE family subunit [Ehrlichia ruminantium]|uniref:Cytochrome c-type biogenesis protein cycK n=1 Tax=Ehrlichia ruminantium (strain Welgevonden) TaxID=254945 RepID=A0A0H3LZ16_EHRRW|nr:heme lyase CcmF/NrfE family subunit [Ehrlichia ruminantium]QLK50167.1 heme lyase CcmF/NrfE family subunit [Ehrlichia ruminantium]QLK51092.1 heme lyase CcmF/NrfE family subunit [Ehrlichia ruminantium]QLK52924.1 heme lyase CcmF/NrfE family subunit [Ehrlichia ruminantium]QLK54762.1 heme lyase CcmF/NrfE family subunit [Ehrlichia ruminantium]QLK55682.1 heme lyase CcmF/NrfE family subunit [Ehrlichia ruminantium]
MIHLIDLPILIACILSISYPFVSLVSYRYLKILTILIFASTSYAMGLLLYIHITNDFSFYNVYYNSHTTKPLLYKISGIWGNHEGSILLWVWIISFYNFLLEIILDKGDLKKVTISIQHIINFGFLLFTILVSNPFVKMPTVEHEGLGFNPMLQDVGLMVHPPILYLGYVGFSVVFSLAIAGIVVQSDNVKWAVIINKWALLAWSFLTLGIGLGSWWAYRELGWGGFWFWDPVENASLMPWLLGTALIHLLPVVKRFNICYNFATLLSISTFTMSLIGTFLVRSGVLISVHAFANDPERGMYLLMLVSIIISSGILSFILFENKVQIKQYNFVLMSRVTMLLFNNVLLLTAFTIVLIGTIYPIVLEFITGDIIAVGAPYYNSLFNYLIFCTLLLMVIVLGLSWNGNKFIIENLKFSGLITLLMLPFIINNNFFVIVIILLSILLCLSVLEGYCYKIKLFLVPLYSTIELVKSCSAKYYSMMFAHIGVAVFILGIVFSSIWGETYELYMKENSSVNVNSFRVVLSKLDLVYKENYNAIRGKFSILKSNIVVSEIFPENRFYLVEGVRNAESAIFRNWLSDIYVVIGDIDKVRGIAVKIYYKPFLNLIWIGFLLITCGGIVGLFSSKDKNNKQFLFQESY